ncbi:MAG: hypothetical protein K2L37_01355, partial [Lactobacillus sp.]|nr:hypothetical protein [Lactobacillus sp.]
MTYYENMGKSVAQESGGGEKDINSSDVFDKSGQFNVGKYSDLLKRNISEALKESDIGILGTMLDSFGDDLAKNPLKYITKAVMDKAIPGAIKQATESVDKHFGNFIGEYIMKQSEDLRGKDNFLAKFLGRALNLNIGRRDKFQLGGKVTTDAAVFDGITRNAITAEIPKYLRESTAYLKQLVELTGGNADSAVANSDIYNKETGMFERYEEYSKNLLSSINNSIVKTFEESDFGKALSKVAVSEELGDRQEEFSNLLNQFYLALEKDERQRIDITKKGEGSDINSIISGLTGNDDIKKLLENAVYSSFDNSKGGMNINISRLAAKNARNNQIEFLEKNRTIDLAEALKGETDPDKISAKLSSPATVSGGKLTPLTQLKRIEDILLRGIN